MKKNEEMKNKQQVRSVGCPFQLNFFFFVTWPTWAAAGC